MTQAQNNLTCRHKQKEARETSEQPHMNPQIATGTNSAIKIGKLHIINYIAILCFLATKSLLLGNFFQP